MFNKLFSKKTKQKDKLTYDISTKARNRLLVTLQRLSLKSDYFNEILEKIHQKSWEEYGNLQTTGMVQPPILDHFHNCDAKEALDFIEMYFRYCNCCPIHDTGVDEINQILIDENIAYQFTKYEFVDVPRRMYDISRGKRNYSINVIHYPQVILRSNDYSHQILEEALIVINDNKFTKANEEFRKALSRFKSNDLAGAMTNCGQAIESTLKFICDKKGWAYDSNDTANKLIKICNENDLFPSGIPVYVSIIESVASLRNKLSDAHGRHGQPFVVDKNHVKHLLNLTATNIIFLATL